jgi:hypothetical protein
MQYLRAALLATALCLVASASGAAEVQKLGWQVMDQWLSGSAGKITSRFANKTIQINVTRRSLGEMKGGPPTGPLIVYLGKGGRMLAWTTNAKVVATGRWEIKDMKLASIPCFYFDGPTGQSDCFFGGTANYVQAATGNVFNLAAGANVPVKLSGRATIDSLTKKLGL